jgi:hypothetical protein
MRKFWLELKAKLLKEMKPREWRELYTLRKLLSQGARD